MAEIFSKKTNSIKVFLIAFLAFSLSILLLFLSPTLILLVFNGPSIFFFQKVYSSQSPDGKFELTVSKKVALPANEFIDPAITVNISLKHIQKNYEINATQFGLYEISDLENPNIIWTSNGVHIENIDTHKQFSFDLREPNYINQY
jgi:hypothetical protein